MIIRRLDRQDYLPVLEEMAGFSVSRLPETEDQIWLLQHNPVYTLGMNADPAHVIKTAIPVIKTDRGGQVTYHGPGQLVVYLLLDLQRLNIKVREYVSLLEQAMIELCNRFQIEGERKPGAPGIYVNNKKIGALGIRIKRGCCYHGIALNVNMDLSPYKNINPCGYERLEVTQLSHFVYGLAVNDVSRLLIPILSDYLGMDTGYHTENSDPEGLSRGMLVA